MRLSRCPPSLQAPGHPWLLRAPPEGGRAAARPAARGRPGTSSRAPAPSPRRPQRPADATRDQGAARPISPFGSSAFISVPALLTSHPGPLLQPPHLPRPLPALDPLWAPGAGSWASWGLRCPSGRVSFSAGPPTHTPGQARTHAAHGTQPLRGAGTGPLGEPGEQWALRLPSGPVPRTLPLPPGSAGSGSGPEQAAPGSRPGPPRQQQESERPAGSAAPPLRLWFRGWGHVHPSRRPELHPHAHEQEEPQVSTTACSSPGAGPGFRGAAGSPRPATLRPRQN